MCTGVGSGSRPDRVPPRFVVTSHWRPSSRNANAHHDVLADADHRSVCLRVPASALESVRRDKGTTLAGGMFSASRSSAFSAVIWLITRTSAGTSVRSRVSSLSLFAMVFFSLAICSRSRISTSGVAAFLHPPVELVAEVWVPLRERVAGHVGLLREGDDRQCPGGAVRGSIEDAFHGLADATSFIGRAAHAVGSCRVMRFWSCCSARARSLAALPRSRSPTGPGAWLRGAPGHRRVRAVERCGGRCAPRFRTPGGTGPAVACR
jgi:hypothetical protein